MGKFKVGDEVKVISPFRKLEIGDVLTVVEVDEFDTKGLNYLLANDEKQDWGREIDLKLVKSKQTKNQRITALEKRVGELELIVHELRERKVIVPSTDGVMGYEPFVPEPVKTPNQLRAEIIEKAKGFVENEKGDFGTYPVMDKESPFPWYCKAEFIINLQKRTVVVLMRGVPSNTIYAKGMAKCNPSDVFNEHIGKAIALGRALGLDVSEFEGAVQPTEFAVGQVIRTSFSRPEQIEIITKIEKNSAYVDTGGFHYLSRAEEDNYKIINDTNAIYKGGVE